MNFAYSSQKFQDWFTQQWVILWGRKINSKNEDWLLGPFGNLNGIGEEFILQLAEKENLTINRNQSNLGLIPNFTDLMLTENQMKCLSDKVIDFYQNTSNYELNFRIKWNLFFKPFGILVHFLFSKRINQLNLPLKNSVQNQNLSSEIIQLLDSKSNALKYTIWLRKSKDINRVVYSGIYGTCKLPNGKTCVKAIFPLPKGNATVLLNPIVSENGDLKLDSSGTKFGDAGFYFLLEDSKGQNWGQFIKSFRDCLIIGENKDEIKAIQMLSLWNFKVLDLKYEILKKLNI